MNSDSQDYALFYKLIEKISRTGFKGMNRDSPILKRLESFAEHKRQFFFIADIIQVRILYTSSRSLGMIGVSPEEVSPYHFFEATHPDDLRRHDLGRTKLFSLAQDIFIKQKGEAILSTNLRIRNSDGLYPQMLIQCYLFYLPKPFNTVYELQLNTDISWFRKKMNGYHHYTGTDKSFFRYPDEKLLLTGSIFTDREFEIIKFIKAGFDSEELAEKLFLSKHTVNTHRKNILKKSGKNSIPDLIYELCNQGLL